MKQEQTIEELKQKVASLNHALSERKSELKLRKKSADLLETLRQVQSLYISDAEPAAIFSLLLKTLVEVTESEYGFFDEVLADENGQLFKKSLAISDISWDDSSKALYRRLQDRDMKFDYLENLAGLPALTGKTVISNQPTLDERSKGLPDGHPPVKSFMGMPLYWGPKLVCVAGVANRQDGYSMEIANFLAPLLSTCAGITYALQKSALESENEKKLRDIEERYRTIVETANEGIWVIDRDLNTTFVNSKMSEILGYEPREMVGRPHADFLFPEELEDNAVKMQRRKSGLSDVYERKFRKKNGDIHWGLVSVRPLLDEKGEFNGSFGMNSDITQRKQAEFALRESERKYRTLFLNLTSGFALHEILLDGDAKPCNYRFLEVNPAFEQLTGLTAEKILGRTVLEVMPDTEPYWIEAYGKVAMTGQPYIFENYSKAMEKHYSVTAYSPEPGRFATLFTDITDRTKAESERLKLAEAVYQASEGIVITRSDGSIEYFNPAFESISGYSSSEIMGLNPRILKSGMQDKAFYEKLWQTILSGARWMGRIVNKRKDGAFYTAECSITPVKNPEGAIIHFVWVTRDITKELEMERRLDQAQKMEAIGSLAGGIAHDFNNLLFPILGMSEMLLDEIPDKDPNRENMEEIHHAAQRASDLVKQILSFSRQSDHKKIPVKIQQVVRDALKLARASIPSNIEIVQNLQNKCGLVMADATQVHQIAMNLITNAYHAVEEKGGRISITVQEAILEENALAGMSIGPGRYVLLRIADTGCGMDQAVMGRIFEPYFTTKVQGKGTGMGLAVVYGIVRDHGGDIHVTSEIGKGTTFEIHLPLMEKSYPDVSPVAVEIVKTGEENILLVDDEKQVVNLVQQVLERLGYVVASRTGSMEALELFKNDPMGFDLVITDMAMPNMTGDKLAKAMIDIRPDMPIIICTGFSERINPEKAASMGIKGFLMKPVVKSDMARMIRKVLDARKHPLSK